MPTGSLVPPPQYRRHAEHKRRLPRGASARLCSACRLQTIRPQLPHAARHAEQAVWPPSAQTASCTEQCAMRHDWHTRACSSQAGCSSTRQRAMPWSAQKSSAQTEQRDVQASQPQWSCRQITRLAGGRPQCGHASNQADPPLRDRCALKVPRRPCADSTYHTAGSTRPASQSPNAPARSSPTLAPADRSYTSLSTTASSTPAPARSTTRATSRPTGCTASFVLLDLTVLSRTGIGSSTPLWSPISRPSSPPVPLSLRERGDDAEDAGAIRPSESRAARARIASISCERNGLPSTAISAFGSRSSASSENATRSDARSLKNGRSAWGKRSSE